VIPSVIASRIGTGVFLAIYSMEVNDIWAQTKSAITVAMATTIPSSIRSEVGDVSLPSGSPDLSEWEQRPRTQIISEKAAAASPYLAGSDRRPRNVRTLRRWRKSQPARGPSFLKIGGRYFYTIEALRNYYQRCVRGGY
jgi:hypothetical protein